MPPAPATGTTPARPTAAPVIDLHAHSSVSDGTESPRALVAAARRAGVDVLGLADHDTTAGWAEAAAAAQVFGVVVVPGIEVSTRWDEADVHLLALWPDDTDTALAAMLEHIRAGRLTRVPRMLDELAGHGVTITERDVRRAAGPAVSLGRPHVADALVAAGVVASREQAFAEWIGEGRPGHVAKPAPPLDDAIGVVRAAGGVTVLAHPWGRGSRAVLGEPALRVLTRAGLDALEVDHVDHDDADRAALRAVAAALGVLVTGGSDYHGRGKAGVALGMNTTSPQVYRELRDRASARARHRPR